MDFSNQYERIARAREKADSLKRGIREWQESRPFSVNDSIAPDRLSWELRLQVINPAPLSDWGFTFGESVHHLRSALDNLVASIAKQSGVASKKALSELYFPIYQTESSYNKEAEKKISPLPQKFKDAIRKIQPFHRADEAGSDPLALLSSLDNKDKHHLQIKSELGPSAVRHQSAMYFATEEEVQENLSPQIEYGSTFENDALLLRQHATAPILRVKGNFWHNAIVQVVLDDGRQFLLIETLEDLHKRVLEVVEAIASVDSH